MSLAFIAGCCALAIGVLMVISLPLACHWMRKSTIYYDPPVIRKVEGQTILGAEHAPAYATLTSLGEPNSWRLDLKPDNAKPWRFLIGAEDELAPVRKGERSLGNHSTPWHSHDTYHPNFGIAVDVLPGTKLEMVLLYENAQGIPTQVDLLFLFGAQQVRISFQLT